MQIEVMEGMWGIILTVHTNSSLNESKEFVRVIAILSCNRRNKRVGWGGEWEAAKWIKH